MAENSEPEEFTRVTETETTVHTVTHTVEKGTSTTARPDSAPKNILRELPSAVLLCAILAGAAVAFDQTSVGEGFSEFTYRLLQGNLAAKDESRVTIVDISSLRQDSGITPRKPLERLLRAIAAQNPAAIGIDIDFSPEDNKFIDPQDPISFFPLCKKLGVPVFLGIYRSWDRPPDQWLGFSVFKDLAAALLVDNNPRRSLWSLSRTATKSDAEAACIPEAPSMSSALATTYLTRTPCEAEEKKRPLERGKESVFSQFMELRIAEPIVFHQFYVDFSYRKRLAQEAIYIDRVDYSDSGLGAIMRSRVRDLERKIVLIGDVRDPGREDRFGNPAQPDDNQVPGVVVEAAATNTLVNRPLYGFPDVNKFWLDFCVSLGIAGLILGVRAAFRDALVEKRLMWLAYGSGAILIFSFGWSVNYTRILWPDFLLLAIGLLVHPRAHNFFEKGKSTLGIWLRKQESQETA